MGKSTPTPPPAPDPVAVAKAQQGTNVGTAIAQSELNNVNTVGPGGSTTYDQTGGYYDPQTRQWIPRFTATTKLSDLGNTLLGGQGALVNEYLPWLEGGAGGLGPLDINGGANAAIARGGPQAYDKTVSDAVYGQQKGFLDPQWGEQQKQLEDQLSRQGIPVGSDAYNSAMKQFENSKTQAYQSAQDSATTQGANIAGQNFGLALQGQQQGVGLQQAAQQNPINLLSMLTSGTGAGRSA